MNIQLTKEIFNLLKNSSISKHHKGKITRALPHLPEDKIQQIHRILANERSKLDEINRQEQRLDLKYQMMIEQLQKYATKKSSN